MTLYEALLSNPVLFEWDKEKLLPFFIRRDIDPDMIFSSSAVKSLELISADIYAQMSLLSDFSEGNLSVKRRSDKLGEKAREIYKKYNDPALLKESKPPLVESADLW